MFSISRRHVGSLIVGEQFQDQRSVFPENFSSANGPGEGRSGHFGCSDWWDDPREVPSQPPSIARLQVEELCAPV